MAREHSITVDSLVPGTTYHFIAMSADGVGNVGSSRDINFTTISEPGSMLPTVAVVGPLTWQGTTLVSADASDDIGVVMVEFLIDGELVFTDYSPPYNFYLDTSRYGNGDHLLTNRVTDTAGNSYQENATVDVVNIKDTDDPTVVITSPGNNETISGKIIVTAALADDTGLFKATMRVAKKGETSSEWWGDWYPPSGAPTVSPANFSLDSYSLDNAEYRLAVEVYDKDLNYGVGFVDITVSNTPPPPPPNLVISRTVTRTQNYFTVNLKVKNTGGETATNVRLLDPLQLFLQLNTRQSTNPNLPAGAWTLPAMSTSPPGRRERIAMRLSR